MCGRFTLHTSLEELLEYFNIANMDDMEMAYRYNIAPSQDILAIVQGKGRKSCRISKMGIGAVLGKGSENGVQHDKCQSREHT